MTHETVLPCCGYANTSAVKWNPFNGVVQCHNCGQVYKQAQRQEPTKAAGPEDRNVYEAIAANYTPAQEPVASRSCGEDGTVCDQCGEEMGCDCYTTTQPTDAALLEAAEKAASAISGADEIDIDMDEALQELRAAIEAYRK